MILYKKFVKLVVEISQDLQLRCSGDKDELGLGPN